ncbi:MAG: cyclodeaminase/cyclohydrolase family protein [Clostridiales bacterium]|jgi:formiminotetrahydrofolate cyclodeaminase|nr:cyclodeaminase/cyclohydrolase family protein [Clostridiales bacterium]
MENLTLQEFTLQVASIEPAPGGGSVSALAGAQAAALLSMYCRLSQGKKGLDDVQEQVEAVMQVADRLMVSLMSDIERDTAAFNAVVAAYRLPKELEEQKKARLEAIQQAFEKAARVPLGVADACLEILEMIKTVAGKGNNSAITDIGVANLQAWAGLQGAVYNVEINLLSLKDTALVKEITERTEHIKTRGAGLSSGNASVVSGMLKGE